MAIANIRRCARVNGKAAGRCRQSAIAGRLDEGDAGRHRQLAHQIGDKDQAAGEDAKQRHRLTIIVCGNPSSELDNTLVNLFGGEKNLHRPYIISMCGTWQQVDVGGHAADVYAPAGASRPGFAVLFLHGVGLETLRDSHAYTSVFDELKLGCISPHGDQSWWVDRVCAERSEEHT